MRLDVVHDTRYDYAAPVSLAHHLAHLQPLHDEYQQLHSFELQIEPDPDQRVQSLDALGNAQCHFSLARPHQHLAVRASSSVRLQSRFDGLQPQHSPPWDGLAQGLRYVARSPFNPVLEYALPSSYVPRLRELRAYAAPSFTPGRALAEAAIELMQRIHDDFRYASRSTEVDTPLARVFLQKSGVCQDFAHLMAGAMRMLGLPVRYVSGYLLTHAPEGGAEMTGADASHAWVQVWCPDTPGVPQEGAAAGWLDLDPTNNLVPGCGHVRLAAGRDFGDVTPLRGVIRGGGEHSLNVAVATRVVTDSEVEPAPAEAPAPDSPPAPARAGP